MENEVRIVGLKVDNPVLDTDEGRIEGPTMYFVTVEKNGDTKDVEITNDAYMDLHQIIGG